MRLGGLSISLKKSGGGARRFPVERRGNAGMVAKEAGEIALRGEAEIAGHGGQRFLRRFDLAQGFPLLTTTRLFRAQARRCSKRTE